MLDYRIKCAREFAYNGIKVKFETGNNGLLNFTNDYSDYIEVIDNGNEVIYRLKDSFTFDMYVSMLTKLNDEVRKIMTDMEIIKSALDEKSLS